MKLRYILMLAISFVLFGCEDYLDRHIDDAYSKDQVFGQYSTMSKAGYGVYNYLPSQYNRIDNAMLASGCDEAHHSVESNKIHRFGLGSWGPNFNPDDVWENFYNGIHAANVFLEESEDYREILARRDTITEGGKDNYVIYTDNIRKLRAEVRFLRAYYYFELGKRYGSVPLTLSSLNLDSDFDKVPQVSFQELVDFIVAECDSVYPILPVTWENYGIPVGETEGIGNCPGISADQTKIGRVIRGAALALKVRALTYAASPLHNPEKDRDKWIRAAAAGNEYFEAAKRLEVPDLLDKDQQAGKSYVATIFNAPFQRGEIILERRFGNNNSFEKANAPIGFTNASGNITCPTQNLVDAFDMNSSADYQVDNPTKSSSYNPDAPYSRRDPRLGYTIVLNNTTINPTLRPVECWVGGQDGYGKPKATTTGYYLRKYVNADIDITQNQTLWHTSVLMRLTEVYLNYAEASNEAYGPDGKAPEALMTAREALNAVRSRVRSGYGSLFKIMPTLVPDDPDLMRIVIQRERQVELAFEEQRFFDIRRWRLMDDPVQREKILTKRGMKITKNEDGTFSYETVVVTKDVWDDKMYLYPIPQSEVVKGHLQQNPGW